MKIGQYFLLVAALAAQIAYGAVSLDTTNAAATNAGASTSVSENVVVAGGDTGLLVFESNNTTAGGNLPSSVKYNGVSATYVSGSQSTDGAGHDSCSIWYLAAPSTGTNSLVVTYSTSTSGATFVIAVPASGIGSLGTPATANAQGTNNNPAVTATGGVSGDVYVGMSYNQDSAQTTSGANQTNVKNAANGNVSSYVDQIPGVDTGAFSWTGSGTSANPYWAASAVVLKAGGASVNHSGMFFGANILPCRFSGIAIATIPLRLADTNLLVGVRAHHEVGACPLFSAS